MSALIKTTIAAFAMTIAAAGSAFADETAVLSNINDEMDANQAKFMEYVLNTSEERINQVQENEDENDIFDLAEKDAQPTS